MIFFKIFLKIFKIFFKNLNFYIKIINYFPLLSRQMNHFTNIHLIHGRNSNKYKIKNHCSFGTPTAFLLLLSLICLNNFILFKLQKKINKVSMSCSTNGYKVPENCQKDAYKMLARQMCPHTCATCCLTKEYNCQNGKN